MAIITKEVLYLGTYADADTNESTAAIENTSIYQSTFGSAGAPISDNLETIDFNDADGSGTIETNNTGTSDTTDGYGGISPVDSLAVVSITATYMDGSTANFTNVVMFQTAVGDLFLANSDFAGTDISPPSGMPLQSFTVTSITSTSYNGLYHQNFQTFACFASGTMVRTVDGERAIESLKAGDMVDTLDHGAQPIRWIGHKTVLALDAMRPVHIAKGALGQSLPSADLMVSRQHMMMTQTRAGARMFGTPDALVAAHKLTDLAGITVRDDLGFITYWHFMCDQHQIVFANDAPAETLFVGPQAQEMLDPEAMTEINALFPELPVRSSQTKPSGKQQRRLVERLHKNQKHVLQSYA